MASAGERLCQYTAVSLRPVSQVRKNANQTLPRINTARPMPIANSNSTDGPASGWRASVGVSMIMPCFLDDYAVLFNWHETLHRFFCRSQFLKN
jgi:hypothetical protein